MRRGLLLGLSTLLGGCGGRTSHVADGMGDAATVNVPLVCPSSAVVVSGDEIATRLAHFLWATEPDAELRRRAAEGTLATQEQLDAQARSMILDSRAKDGVRQFFADWLWNAFPATPREPDFADLRHSMEEESTRFIDWVLFESDSRLRTLLTSPVSFVDKGLASIYGLPNTDGGFVRVNLDPTQRAGLLTQASVLSLFGDPDQGNPSMRGFWAARRLVCSTVPPEPSPTGVRPPRQYDLDRDVYEHGVSQVVCQACHKAIDTLGFGFENYDGLGRWQTTFAGRAIDATGQLYRLWDNVPLPGDPQPFDGVVGLSHLLAEDVADDEQVHRCFAETLARFAAGTSTIDLDECHIRQLGDAFLRNRGNVIELMIAIAASDFFRAPSGSPPSQ